MSRETSADPEGRGGGGGGSGGGRPNTGAEEIGPGQIYMPFVVMEVREVDLDRKIDR